MTRPDRERTQVWLDPPILARIDKERIDRRVHTRAEMIRYLIALGLRHLPPPIE